MIIIDQEKCIGCGLCAQDCISKNIEITQEKAVVKSSVCLKCGHCIAICPQNAVITDEYDMADVKEYNKSTFSIEPERLLNFIQFRRSVRQFTKQPVDNSSIMQIIEAGRFTPTGSNRQNLSYIVIKDSVPQLRRLALERLSEAAQAASQQSPEDPARIRFAKRWIELLEADKEEPGKNDSLFYNAPVVVLVVGDSTVDAALAASNMELMTYAQGLGMFYCGFFVMSAAGNSKMNAFLGLAGSQEVKICLVLGHPEVTYARTAARKAPQVKLM